MWNQYYWFCPTWLFSFNLKENSSHIVIGRLSLDWFPKQQSWNHLPKALSVPWRTFFIYTGLCSNRRRKPLLTQGMKHHWFYYQTRILSFWAFPAILLPIIILDYLANSKIVQWHGSMYLEPPWDKRRKVQIVTAPSLEIFS